MSRIMLKTFISAATLLVATPALAQTVFVNEATLATPNGMAGPRDVIIREGKITEIGTGLSAPSGAQIIKDGWVTSGIFSPFSTLGLVDIGGEDATNDTTASGAKSNVSMRAVDSFNPKTAHIANARRLGLTHAVVALRPSNDSIFGGIGLIASLSGEFDSVLDDAAFLYVTLGEAGASRTGGSRSSAMAQFRAAIRDAASANEGDDARNVLSRDDALALQPALRGEMPILVSANRASDILSLIRMKEATPSLDIIIVGAKEAHLVADEIAASGVKLLIDPHDNLPEGFDAVNASFDNASILEDAGVDYAIGSMSSLGVAKAGALRQHAGNAVGHARPDLGHGLSWSQAFAAISFVPAAWFGVELDPVAVGADTFVVWDDDPLQVTSAPIHMAIDGQVQSLESRQTRLRDRYNPLNEDERPHKYR